MLKWSEIVTCILR